MPQDLLVTETQVKQDIMAMHDGKDPVDGSTMAQVPPGQLIDASSMQPEQPTEQATAVPGTDKGPSLGIVDVPRENPVSKSRPVIQRDVNRLLVLNENYAAGGELDRLSNEQATDLLRRYDTIVDALESCKKQKRDKHNACEELADRLAEVQFDLPYLDSGDMKSLTPELVELFREGLRSMEIALRARRNLTAKDIGELAADASGNTTATGAKARRLQLTPEIQVISAADYSERHSASRVALDYALEYSEARPSEAVKDDWRRLQVLSTKAKQIKADPAEKEVPEVLRIQSEAVIRLLAQLSPSSLTGRGEEADVPGIEFLRPYKLFIELHDEIRAKHKELKAKLDSKAAYMQLCLEAHDIARHGTSASAIAQTSAQATSSPEIQNTALDGTSEKPTTSDDQTEVAGNEPRHTSYVAFYSSNFHESGPSPVPDIDLFTAKCDLDSLTYPELAEAYTEFDLLVKFIDEHILPRRALVQKKPATIFFSDLWYMFEPGRYLFVNNPDSKHQTWQVLNCVGGRRLHDTERVDYSKLSIDCYHLDFDGRKWQQVFKTFEIESFPDTRPPLDLQYWTSELAEAEGKLSRKALLTTASEFMSCLDKRHRYYSGRSIDTDAFGEGLERSVPDDLGATRLYSKHVESQVIIDFERALQANPTWRNPSQDADTFDWTRADGDETYDTKYRVSYDTLVDIRLRGAVLEPLVKLWQSWERGDLRPSGDSLLLLRNRVYAFVLRDREWASLRCTGEAFKLVSKRADAWNELKIEENHKSIVQSLVEARFTRGHSSPLGFDLIRDKGKGLIVLLHGAPGVGKTSTAECVAEFYGKPLLPITCGDLGLTAERVEAKLQESFQLAQTWDCVLLLDEADVFLAARTPEDVKRNALVSVFLRVLEYYEGILFLTTNRVGTFDEAFRSRIHMSLHYRSLDWSQTEAIWRSQIERLKSHEPPVDCNTFNLVTFAEQQYREQESREDIYGPPWNGRQIRNAFQSAIALSRRQASERAGATAALDIKRIEVTEEHFRKVARVADAFNDYMVRLHNNKNDARRARDEEVRHDYHNYQQYGDTYAQKSNRYQLASRTAMHHDGSYRMAPELRQQNVRSHTTADRLSENQYGPSAAQMQHTADHGIDRMQQQPMQTAPYSGYQPTSIELSQPQSSYQRYSGPTSALAQAQYSATSTQNQFPMAPPPGAVDINMDSERGGSAYGQPPRTFSMSNGRGPGFPAQQGYDHM